MRRKRYDLQGLGQGPQCFLVNSIALISRDPENYAIMLVDHFAAPAATPDLRGHLAGGQPLAIDIDSSGIIPIPIGANGISIAILHYLKYLFKRLEFADNNLSSPFRVNATGINIVHQVDNRSIGPGIAGVFVDVDTIQCIVCRYPARQVDIKMQYALGRDQRNLDWMPVK